VALLLWIYYSAQIFFLGAELTTVCARRSGQAPVPSGAPKPSMEGASPARAEPPRSSSWPARLGWVALGIVLARFFRR